MATTKTIQPTGTTITIPAMTDRPDASVYSTDVDRITDAVNSLNSNITELTANDLNTAVDLSGYASGQYYAFPIDGYIRVFCSTNSYIIYRLYGETGTRFIYNEISNDQRQTLFVKKGMRYECRAQSGSLEIEFFGLV